MILLSFSFSPTSWRGNKGAYTLFLGKRSPCSSYARDTHPPFDRYSLPSSPPPPPSPGDRNGIPLEWPRLRLFYDAPPSPRGKSGCVEITRRCIIELDLKTDIRDAYLIRLFFTSIDYHHLQDLSRPRHTCTGRSSHRLGLRVATSLLPPRR